MDVPGKSTKVGCHFLLQGVFPTQGSNPNLLHWQVASLPPSHLGSPTEKIPCYKWLWRYMPSPKHHPFSLSTDHQSVPPWPWDQDSVFLNLLLGFTCNLWVWWNWGVLNLTTVGECLCPPRMHILKLNPWCGSIWRWGLWEIILSWWWGPYEEDLCPYKRNLRKSPLPFCKMRMHLEDTVCQPGSVASPDTESAASGSWTSSLQTVRKKSLLFMRHQADDILLELSWWTETEAVSMRQLRDRHTGSDRLDRLW